MDPKKYRIFFSFFCVFLLLLPLALLILPIISLELCLDANVDVFFFLLGQRSTVSNSPHTHFLIFCTFGILR
jgi:hypothetical protein